MKNEIKLFDEQGDFSLPLTINIMRYSKEYNVSIHDIISIFKNAGVTKSEMVFSSFSGYEAFKSKIEIIKNHKKEGFKDGKSRRS